jgi:predicted alpha/beta-hydrolase family hydrolase
MATTPIEIRTPGGKLDAVGGFYHEPEGAERDSAILLAHGAGADVTHEFMTDMAAGLVGLGFSVLAFRYPYMQLRADDGKRRGPDRAAILEATHEHALAELARRRPGKRLLLAGKSMGGRMGTRIAAKGADCAGLILFGYPLHPPGRPEKVRSEHFPAIVQPALFLQGTRDKLCDLELLRHALKTYGGTPSLEIVEEGDHGFAVPKRTGLTQSEVRADLSARVDAWERRTFPT